MENEPNNKHAIVLCSGGIDSVTTAHYIKKNLGYSNITILFVDYGQKSAEKERECAKKCANDIRAGFKEIGMKWLGEISTALLNKQGTFKELSEEELNDAEKEKAQDKLWWVPCRNTLFLAAALAHAESAYISNNIKLDIFVGFKNEGLAFFKDQTPEFLAKINEFQKNCTLDGNYKIIAPLIEKDKEDIILLAKELGVDLKNTFSCYTGKEKHCGKCLACKSRQKGFYWANIEDSTDYD